MADEKVMVFANREMRDELNLTVRRGVKWDGVKGIIATSSTDKYYEGRILVQYTQVLRFCDIPAGDLRYEHDEQCRTIGGLYNVMNKVYNEFGMEEIVTLVWFTEAK